MRKKTKLRLASEASSKAHSSVYDLASLVILELNTCKNRCKSIVKSMLKTENSYLWKATDRARGRPGHAKCLRMSKGLIRRAAGGRRGHVFVIQ